MLLWAIVLAVVGIGLLWRQADEAQRTRWLDQSERLNPVRAVFGAGGWAAYLRVGAGVVLVVGSVVLFAVRTAASPTCTTCWSRPASASSA